VKINWMFAWIIGAVLVAGTIVGVTTASGQKAAGNPPAAKLKMATMDTDNDGTVSKEEFMIYMEDQFNKADADHDGTLDAKEFEQLRKNLAASTTK
jgi:Ca2+-binding EF-hand superfamily protein